MIKLIESVSDLVDYKNLVEQIVGRKFKNYVVIEETPYFYKEREKVFPYLENKEGIYGFSIRLSEETELDNRIRILLPPNLDEYEKTYIIGHELGEHMFRQESRLDPYAQIRKFYEQPNSTMGKILIELEKKENMIKKSIKEYLLGSSPFQIPQNILSENCLEEDEFAKSFLIAQITCEKNETLKRILSEGFAEQVGAELCSIVNDQWRIKAREDLDWRYIDVICRDGELWLYGLGVIYTDYLRRILPNFPEFSSYVFSLYDFNKLENEIKMSYSNSKSRISNLVKKLIEELQS